MKLNKKYLLYGSIVLILLHFLANIEEKPIATSNQEEVFPRLSYLTQEKLMYCPIQKNLNSQLHALIARVAYGEYNDITTYQGIVDLYFGLIDLKVSHANIQWNIMSDSPLWSDNSVVKFVILRDPIDRFISAYLHFCHFDPLKCFRPEINNCGPNIHCLLARLREIHKLKLWNSYGHIGPVTHFAPQMFQCYLRLYWDKYRIFIYSTSEEFKYSLRNFLISNGISNKTITTGWGNKGEAWLSQLTTHATNLKFSHLKKEILTNLTLVDEIFRFYQLDYQFFNHTFHLSAELKSLCQQNDHMNVSVCNYIQLPRL